MPCPNMRAMLRACGSLSLSCRPKRPIASIIQPSVIVSAGIQPNTGIQASSSIHRLLAQFCCSNGQLNALPALAAGAGIGAVAVGEPEPAACSVVAGTSGFPQRAQKWAPGSVGLPQNWQVTAVAP